MSTTNDIRPDVGQIVRAILDGRAWIVSDRASIRHLCRKRDEVRLLLTHDKPAAAADR